MPPLRGPAARFAAASEPSTILIHSSPKSDPYSLFQQRTVLLLQLPLGKLPELSPFLGAV